MRVLITGGGCREYIDSVRVVTNSSTGKTSASLADFFASKGAEVTLITAENAIKAETQNIKTILFQTGEELAHSIENELCSFSYDAVIHAAAVSDYVPSKIIADGKTYEAGKNLSKINSSNELTVVFRSSPKIADFLRSWAETGGNPEAKIICFKLTSGADSEEKQNAVSKLFSHSKADYIVANELSEITEKSHPFKIFGINGKVYAEGSTNELMAKSLYNILI